MAGLEEVVPSTCHWTHAVVVIVAVIVIVAISVLVALVIVVIVLIVFIVIAVVVVMSPGSARWPPSTSSLLWPLPSLSV